MFVAVLGLLDFFTGWQFGFFVFYFLPISYTAWYAGLKPSLFIAILSAITWCLADFLLHDMHFTTLFLLWNTAIRLFSFILISFFISKIKELLTMERKVSQDLRNALEQIKILRGFLPICASCKKIRNDQGYWEQLESYISQHSEAEFTHGICEACARRLYPTLYTEGGSKQEEHA